MQPDKHGDTSLSEMDIPRQTNHPDTPAPVPTEAVRSQTAPSTDAPKAPKITAVPPDAYETHIDSSSPRSAEQNSGTGISSAPAESQTEDTRAEQAENSYSFATEKSAPTINASTKSLVLSINSASDYAPAGEYAMRSMSSDYSMGISSFEDWNNEKYFEYLGRNITGDISLPEDFNYIGGDDFSVTLDQNGEPLMDKRIFPYQGSGDRYITLLTSKNLSDAYVYLDDTHYSLSDIYGTKAVIIGYEGGYKCYLIYDNISFIITADGVSEDELKQILTSVTKEDN